MIYYVAICKLCSCFWLINIAMLVWGTIEIKHSPEIKRREKKYLHIIRTPLWLTDKWLLLPQRAWRLLREIPGTGLYSLDKTEGKTLKSGSYYVNCCKKKECVFLWCELMNMCKRIRCCCFEIGVAAPLLIEKYWGKCCLATRFPVA